MLAIQAEVQVQRVRADSAREALAALQAWVDAGEFAVTGVPADTGDRAELERLRGEAAILRAERKSYQRQVDEYRRQRDLARQMVQPGAAMVVMQEANASRRQETRAVREAAYYRALYREAVPADQRQPDFHESSSSWTTGGRQRSEQSVGQRRPSRGGDTGGAGPSQPGS